MTACTNIMGSLLLYVLTTSLMLSTMYKAPNDWLQVTLVRAQLGFPLGGQPITCPSNYKA